MTTLLSYRRTAFAAGLVISVLPIFAVALSPGVAGAVTATSVSTNNSSTCATNATGGVDCWGDNTKGKLGNGSTTNSSSPVAVSAITGALDVSAGASHSCALLSSGGAVKCWGDNTAGELGIGALDYSSTPVEVVSLLS